MPGQALVTIGDKEWRVYLATTPYELTRGLGGLPSIPMGAGMLFDMGAEQSISVTTVPMLFPLDIVFIKGSLIINGLASNVAPGYLVTSEAPARYFLEVNAGEAQGIAAGDRAIISYLTLGPQQGAANSVVNFAAQALAFGLGVSFFRKVIKNVTGKGHPAVLPGSNIPGQKLLPQTGKRVAGEYEIKADKMGNVIIARTDDPGKDVFLQFESDKGLVYEILRKGERKDLDAGWPIRIKTGEPRTSILDELWQNSAQPKNLSLTRIPQTAQPGTAKADECGQPIPTVYRDLTGFISQPPPDQSLAFLPAVVPAEGERKIDAVLKQLKDGVEHLQDSNQFRLFLTTMSKFHDYSIGNLILIALQKPDATRVAGFHTWKDLGRWVKQGEKGIAILAPIMPRRPKKEKREDGEEDAAAEIAPSPVYFKVVHVFDVSQTEGKPLPEFEAPVLTGEANEELFARAVNLGRAQGLEISFESRPDLDPDLKGSYSRGRRIWVRPEEPRAQQLKTLLHELAHHFAESVFQIPRAEAEVMAESSAFVVGAHFGFDTGARSFPYIAIWSRDKKLLAVNLNSIRKISERMIEGLDKFHAEVKKQVESAYLPRLKPPVPAVREGAAGKLDYLADSCNQCQRSINGTGLRPKLEQVFHEAIARSKARRREAKQGKGENI